LRVQFEPDSLDKIGKLFPMTGRREHEGDINILQRRAYFGDDGLRRFIRVREVADSGVKTHGGIVGGNPDDWQGRMGMNSFSHRLYSVRAILFRLTLSNFRAKHWEISCRK
jgi:hypothetical protein